MKQRAPYYLVLLLLILGAVAMVWGERNWDIISHCPLMDAASKQTGENTC